MDDLSNAVIGIDMGAGPSRTILVVHAGRKGVSARSAAMAEALKQHGYDVEFQDVKDCVSGLNPHRVVLDELEEFKRSVDPVSVMHKGRPDFRLKYHQALPAHPRSPRKANKKK
jgi:hypothetical protein